MTNEQAIQVLINANEYVDLRNSSFRHDLNEAINIAMDAIRDQAKQPQSDEVKRAIDYLEAQKKRIPFRQENITERNLYDLAITALRQMQTKPDCLAAEWNGGKCCGFGKAENDDEPIDACKACSKQASYGVE